MLTLPTDAHTTTSDMRQMAKGNDAYRADRVTAAAATTTETVNQSLRGRFISPSSRRLSWQIHAGMRIHNAKFGPNSPNGG